ncbi:hypothetical protein [Eubacterium sp. 1001713B170207_170306_E7]|uniref:hypothetical protein n=1 Tax=Eubacterium sp. 1001713B170207_170306_E7 TaxID=2787097 RepID=UPI00189A978C|nr:hypothetical protein [Eubacterium sp. 1001713B170207_170306_E7]
MKALFKKRTLAFLFALLMLISSLPVRAFAQEAETNAAETADYTPVDWDSIQTSLENQPVLDMDNLPASDQAIVPDDSMVMDPIADDTPAVQSQEQPELNQAPDNNFSDKCGSLIIDWAVNKALDWTHAKIMDAIFKDTTPTMNDLFNNQKIINDKLDVLINEVKLTDYKEDLRNKQAALNNIYDMSDRTSKLLQSNPDRDTRIANMKPLYKGDGKDYCSDIVNFANTYLTDRAKRMPNGCIFNVYDLYAKRYYPWENQGYGFRENMRNLDLAEFYQSAAIALIGCKAHMDSDSPLKAGAETTYNQLTEVIKQVAANTKKFPVKHLPENETLFQVPGKERHFIWNMNVDRYSSGGYTDWTKIAHSDLGGLRGKAARWTLEAMTIKSGSLGGNKYHAPETSDYRMLLDYYKTAQKPQNLGTIMADSGRNPARGTIYPTNHLEWNNQTFTNDYRFICGGVLATSSDGDNQGFFLGKYWLDGHDEADNIRGWGSGLCYPDKFLAARIFLVR